MEYYGRALALAQTAASASRQSRACCAMANCWSMQNSEQIALKYYKKGLQVHSEFSCPSWRG